MAIARTACHALASGTAALLATPVAAEEQSLRFSASYVSDLISTLSGGERRGTAWLGRADLTAELDGASLDLDGVTAFADLMFTHGPDFSGIYAGDAQVVSNVQAERALRLFEAWVSVPLAGDAMTVKAGLVDLNSEFDVQEVGGLFLNSSHGIGPDFSQSGLNGPSIFPATSAGVVLTGIWSGGSARLGIFDAVAGKRSDPRRVALRLPGEQGALLVGELDVGFGQKVTAKLGVWSYTSRFDAIWETEADGNPRRLATSRGAYATLEGRLAGDEEGALDGWMRLGVANPRVNPIATYWGGGLTYGNDRSRIGLAVANARLGDAAVRLGRAGGQAPERIETAVELSYRHALGPHVAIQPDLQYVINPGWEPARRDALVAALRLSIDLGSP